MKENLEKLTFKFTKYCYNYHRVKLPTNGLTRWVIFANGNGTASMEKGTGQKKALPIAGVSLILATVLPSCTPSSSLTSKVNTAAKTGPLVALPVEMEEGKKSAIRVSVAESAQKVLESEVVVEAPPVQKVDTPPTPPAPAPVEKPRVVDPEPVSSSSSPIVLASANSSSYSPGSSFNVAPSTKPSLSETLRPTMVPPGGVMMVRTTAYCHKEADSLPYGKLNAAGTELKYGGLIRSAAADWSRYPVGTRFRITGMPYEFVVDDYGSALVGTNTIDIYKPTFAAMNAWGVRNVPIQVIEWGSFEVSHRILDGRKHVPHANHVRTMLREIERKAAASAAYERAEQLEMLNTRA